MRYAFELKHARNKKKEKKVNDNEGESLILKAKLLRLQKNVFV